jgi:hypothetical protein
VKVEGAGVEKWHPLAICVEQCEGSEAFVLLGMSNPVRKGEEGYIEFKQGGPTGGFWEFHKGSPIIIPG